MRVYENHAEVHEHPPIQGEIYVAPDPQNRCGKDTWAVYQYWNPRTWKTSWNGEKYTVCPEIDIICRGLFWHKKCAEMFAEKLEAGQ